MQQLRLMAKCSQLICLRARLCIVSGDVFAALRCLQTGYAMARHTAEGRLPIATLAAMGISRRMSAQLRELMQLRQTPNLYWALTALPHPLIDMSEAFETEMHFLELTHPKLRELDSAANDTAAWGQLVSAVAKTAMDSWGTQAKLDLGPAVWSLASTGGDYAQARRDLVTMGYKPDEVQGMSVPQLTAIHGLRTYGQARDRLGRWLSLPYWQARKGLEEAMQAAQQKVKPRAGVPLKKLLLPRLYRCYFRAARHESNLAILRTVEALRGYAAVHGGRLPQQLADVAEWPIPIDPLTGEPPQYRVEQNMATIESPALPGVSAVRYEVTVIRSTSSSQPGTR